MSKNNFKNRLKIDDHPIDCDICGMPCWASEAIILEKETGRGGMVVCPVDRDVIDYGIVPYKILPEEPIQLVRTANYQNNPSAVPTMYTGIDFSIDDPMNTSPSQLTGWENQLEEWDEWDTPWGE